MLVASCWEMNSDFIQDFLYLIFLGMLQKLHFSLSLVFEAEHYDRWEVK